MNDVTHSAPPAHAAEPQIVRPRDAASLILLRGHGRDLELLAGRRAGHVKFMPGVYVFPGGAIDREDRRPWRVENRTEALTPRLQPSARAALRETWEEVGVVVGRKAEDPIAAIPITATPAMLPIEAAYAERGLVVALDILTYVGRAITPTPVFRRFNTRFFLADGEHVVGEPQSSEELEDAAWHPIGRQKLSPFRDVTEFMLSQAIALREGTAGPDAPLLCTVNKTRRIRVCREAIADL
jgi:8-oxo-dGTP pyrophosphatase MutT (NUDIX family)